MRTLTVAVFCLVAVGLVAANASANATSLLIKDGRINTIQDLDYESLIDLDRSGTVTQGDVFFGMYQMEGMSYTPIAPPPVIGADAFTGIFVLAVTSATFTDQNGNGVFDTEDVNGNSLLDAGEDLNANGILDGEPWTYLFGPTSAATFAAITGQVPTAAAGTIGIFYSDSVKDFGAQWIDPTTGNINSALGIPLWEFGFTGAAGEFWGAISQVTNVLSPNTDIGYAGALNLTGVYPGAGGVALNKHMHLAQANGFTFTAATHLQLEGDKGSHNPGAWGLATDTDLHIAPTPEPGSLALLGLGLAAIGGVVYRRRRRS